MGVPFFYTFGGSMLYRSIYNSPIGEILILYCQDALLGLYFEVPNQVNKIVFNAYDILHNDMTPRLSDVIRRRPKKERGE